MWLWSLVVLAGAAGQFLDTVAGMGFGALSSTIMVGGGLAPSLAIGTVNLAKVGSGLASGLSHWRFGNIRWPWVLPMGIPAVAGGVAGATLVTGLPEQALGYIVSGVLLLMGLLVLRRFLSRSLLASPVGGGSDDVAVALPMPRGYAIAQSRGRAGASLWLGAVGLISGLLNGLSGAFGPFATSAILLKQGGHPRFAVGTVNFVEFFVAGAVSVTILARVQWSSSQWALPLALVAGSLVTAPLGARLSRHLPPRVAGVAVGVCLVGLNIWGLAVKLLE